MRSLWLGAVLFATGLLIASAIGFDRYWMAAAQGQHDIMARSGFLYVLLLPMLVAVTLMLTWALYWMLMRGVPLAPWQRLAMPLSAVGGGIVGAFVLSLVPMFLPLRGAWLGPAAALAAIGSGATLMVRGARGLRTASSSTPAV
jgi:hypothetical protein